MSPTRLEVACLCGSVSQEVDLKAEGGSDTVPLALCHCNTCRHASGLLCTSYYPITAPKMSSCLEKYRSKGKSTRYFCATCGCHLFQATTSDGGNVEWGAATGATTCLGGQASKAMRYTYHKHVSDTQDGGLSVWVQAFPGHIKEGLAKTGASQLVDEPVTQPLQASCACGNVRFHITRPNRDSYSPRRGYPDLMFPYKTTPSEVLENPTDDKWWIQGRGQKYLAGTCACQSCRLASGFEIQTWSFVPRANIFFHISQAGQPQSAVVALDFASLPAGILTTYASSPNVQREFCGACGATVFWHDKDHDEVVDISVGLFRAPDGARAESWLDWWRERVSFAEDAGCGRTGSEAELASTLIDALQSGMAASN